MSGRTDREEVRQAVFVALYAGYAIGVRRHIESQVDDPADADELVADVFRIAWEKLNPDRPMGLAWLLRTADNRLRNREKRDASKDRAMAALVRRAQHSQADPADAVAIGHALASLSERERRIVTLTYWDQLSAGEIAEVMRMSQGSVWTTLTRARAKLRAQLDESGEEARHG